MRKLTFALALSLCACQDDDERFLPVGDGGTPDAAADASTLDASLGSLDATIQDASAPLDARVVDAADGVDATVLDAAVDAGGCKPTVLLQGGADVVPQGWTVISQAPSELSYVQNVTRLVTSTNPGGRTSGQLLLSYPNAVQVPFAIEVVLRVESASPHNPFDSAAAILGSLNGGGTEQDRSQMVYLDSTSIGWADNSQSAVANVIDGKSHSYVLSVDAQNVARLDVDGVAKLTRSNFVTNGTIAVGDQTNDFNVDAVLQIESVRKLCLD